FLQYGFDGGHRCSNEVGPALRHGVCSSVRNWSACAQYGNTWANNKHRRAACPQAVLESAPAMARPPELIHAVDETPPLPALSLGAVQHIAVNTSLIVYPMMLAAAAGLSAVKTMDLVALSVLALGLATILMSLNTRWVGSGYLCPAAYSLTFLTPALYAAQQ